MYNFPMKPATSIAVFGVYLVVVGATLVLVPNLLLSLLFFPTSTEVWPRLVGVLTVILGFFFLQSARSGFTAFFRWTIAARCFLFLSVSAFALLGLVTPMLVLFGVVDLVGAAWTWYCLRKSA